MSLIPFNVQGLLLLIQLTKGNANIQKIVVFENAFEKLLEVIFDEGSSDGGKSVVCVPMKHEKNVVFQVLTESVNGRPDFRHRGGGLSAASAKPREEQHLQPDVLQGGQLHSETAGLFQVGPGGRESAGRLVCAESYQHPSHVASELGECWFGHWVHDSFI